MAISCSCEEYEIMAVGDPHEVICRTPRKCSVCDTPINVLDHMYRWSMYDFGNWLAVAPNWLCEECGDMSVNLMEQGYCFNFSSSIKEQWLDYLYDTDPTNPAVEKWGKDEVK